MCNSRGTHSPTLNTSITSSIYNSPIYTFINLLTNYNKLTTLLLSFYLHSLHHCHSLWAFFYNRPMMPWAHHPVFSHLIVTKVSNRLIFPFPSGVCACGLKLASLYKVEVRFSSIFPFPTPSPSED